MAKRSEAEREQLLAREQLARRQEETANQQLRESEEKYRALFDSIDEGFCIVEVLFDASDHAVDYRFLEVNQVFEKQTGIANAVGRRMREIAPAHEEHWFQIYGQIALTGESRRFQNPALALGRFYDVYAFRVGRPEQRQVAILFNDITKRKQAEEALHRSQALNQAVLDSLAATIAVLDRDGNIIAVNDAWKRFARGNDGAAVADSVGVNYLQVCRDARESGDGGSAALNGIQAVLTGRRHHFELDYPCHSPSEERWFLMSVTPLLGERDGAVVTHTDITARKGNEWALQESEERFRLTIDEAPIGMALVALDGRFVRVNRVLCEIVGYSFAELTELTFQAITHPDDLDADFAFAGQLARGVVPRYQLEKRYIRKDGTIVDVLLSASILRAPDKAPLYYIVQIEDITDRKRTEKALRRSESQFRGLIEHLPDGVFAYHGGRIVYANDAFASLLGHDDPAALVGHSIFELLDHDDHPAVVERIRAVEQTGLPAPPMEFRMIGRDGSLRSVETVGLQAQFDGQSSIVVIVRDLTERKRAQQALQRSEREFRELAESMPQIVWTTRADGWNIYFNQQWVDYTGLTLEESYGEGWITPFHPDDRQRAWDAWQRATQHRDTYSLECRLRRADGIYRWWLIRGVPLLGPNGEITKWFGTCTDIEQIKIAEQRLRESEAKFSGIISISADAIISIDNEQRISLFNSGAERIFGYSTAEVIGTPLERLIPERFRAAHRQNIEKFAAGDVIARRMGERLTTIGGLRKNGEEFPAEAAISKLQVGEKTLLTVALRDITERKRIEEELKAANAFLDAIIDNIPLMLFMKESQSLRFARFNRAGEDLLGWPRHHLIGKKDYDLWPQAQADFFVERDREALNSGTIVDIPEESIQTRHQGVRLLHTKKVPILDAAGHPTYLLGISEDITERRRLEQEQQFLAEAGVLLSASLDYEPTVVTVAQLVVQHLADWCAVDVMDENGRLSRLKVASADPAKAALCAVLEQMPPNRELPNFVRSVSEGGRPITIEHVTTEWVESFAQAPEHLQAILATGVLSLIAVPLMMREQCLGVMVFGSSSPSRVYGPGDLRTAAALADRAAVAIEHARLYRAAREATELRERVLGIVAHDLRNPLAAIRIQTSFLKRRAPEPERRSQKPVDAINSVVMRMDRLIQDLLSAALIEAGELTMQPTRLSPSRLMTEAVEMERPVASSSSVELQLDLEPDMRDLWADHDRLLQVFENLIGNAIKFTSPGGRITVGAASTEDEVLFSVADTGRGISPGDVPHIFERFWRATERTGRVGAGLGLHITKGIVEAHGGRIWVESTPGRGSTFFFSIPTLDSQTP